MTSNLEKITIRSAVIPDLLTMFRVMDEALESPSDDDELEERVARWSTRFTEDSSFIFYVVMNDTDNMIGWCSGRPTLESNRIVDDQTYDCEVGHMFILKEYQHRGIGRELWKIIWNDVLRRLHPRNLIVWAVDKEQTHQFYLSLGGIPIGKKNVENTILTAYVWNDLRPYDSTNFVMFK
jgi:GNAT superfamily N-acetyltransferase